MDGNKLLDSFYIAIIAILVGTCVLGFIFGWLFPVEGPFDYVYDKYASQPAHRHPAKTVPKQPSSVIININDLSQEDFEALQEIFVNLRK